MPLYRVKVTYETVVYANDEVEAGVIAVQRDNDSMRYTDARLINATDDLPEPWTSQCVPYGGDDSTTIRGHLKQLKV